VAGKSKIAVAVLAVAMSACSHSERYVKTDAGPCVIHYTDRFLGVPLNQDESTVKQCPKALQEKDK
jgi:hypothetical protein